MALGQVRCGECGVREVGEQPGYVEPQEGLVLGECVAEVTVVLAPTERRPRRNAAANVT